jgi:CRISPR/Cas system-associated endoribonuclease Cas2
MHKKLLGFGDRLQLSVFRCDLNAKERVLLQKSLLETMNQKEDLVMVIDLGPSDVADCFEFLGRTLLTSDRKPVIV